MGATNALNQSGQAGYDARFGAKLWSKDANGLQSTWTLDAFGRPTRETRPDGTSVVMRYCYIPGRISDLSSNSPGCDTVAPADAPADAVSYLHSEPRDTQDAQMGPYTRIYSDGYGRELRQVTQSFDGANQPAGRSAALIVKDTVYSAVGTKIIETQPYFLASGSSTTGGSNDRGATLMQYDPLGRPVNIYTADPQGLAGNQTFGAYGSATASKASFSYSGQTTTQTNDKGQVRTEEKNAAGLLVRITDPAGGQLAHQHDAFGNLVATKDALQNTIQIKYSIRGFRLELNDPDAGLWKYDYDPLGQLVWQENAKQRAAGTVTTMVYDKLGRMVSRVEPEGTGAWSYDKYADNSACATGIGRLCESSFTRAGSGDIRKTKTTYDALGRPISDVATITNGPTLSTGKGYDAATGRMVSKTYPTGLQVQYAYTALGYQWKLTRNVNSVPTTLWQANAINAMGKIEQQLYGNGVVSRATYQAQTGRTTALTAGLNTSNTVVNYGYTWDSLNNLTYRVDNIGDEIAGAVSETFEYADGLSRLTKYTVAAPAVPNGSRAVNLTYNALGMLLNKSDVGVYAYGASGPGATRPHALQSMAPVGGGATVHYVYDANGNLTSADGGKYRSIAYTSFNLPDGQTGLTGAPDANGWATRYTWNYDENHQRIREVRTSTIDSTRASNRKTWYLHPDNAGGLGFEYEVDELERRGTSVGVESLVASARHYLTAGGQSIGVLISSVSRRSAAADMDFSCSTETNYCYTYVWQPIPDPLPTILSGASRTEYWHKDHLGSLIATTDDQASVTARYAYDPFGKRRYTNGSYDAFGSIVVDWKANWQIGAPAFEIGTDRGFTGHEHLDDVGVIHMNGRVFDPTLGRFLQADRFIAMPAGLQYFDRFAYCRNNPLTCTDPTGLWDNDADIPRFRQDADDGAAQVFALASEGAGYSVQSNSVEITGKKEPEYVAVLPFLPFVIEALQQFHQDPNFPNGPNGRDPNERHAVTRDAIAKAIDGRVIEGRKYKTLGTEVRAKNNNSGSKSGYRVYDIVVQVTDAQGNIQNIGIEVKTNLGSTFGLTNSQVTFDTGVYTGASGPVIGTLPDGQLIQIQGVAYQGVSYSNGITTNPLANSWSVQLYNELIAAGVDVTQVVIPNLTGQ